MPKANEKALRSAEAALNKVALAYPGATEEFPWGERVVKVNKKVFVFIGIHEGIFHLSVKLPQSSAAALMFPFAEPTGYGLGKSGWVSAKFTGEQEPPVELLRAWIDESFRAVAPKKVVAALDAGGAAAAPVAKKKTVVRKPAARRGGVAARKR